MPKNKEGKELTCQKCQNTWLTRAIYKLVSCPNCGTKVKKDTEVIPIENKDTEVIPTEEANEKPLESV